MNPTKVIKINGAIKLIKKIFNRALSGTSIFL